jgi:hypothetical protein
MKPIVFMVFIAIVLVSCSAGFSEKDISQIFPVSTSGAIPIEPEMLTPYTSPQPTETTMPTATHTSTPTSALRPTHAPTLTPSPTSSQPSVLFELSGSGKTVTKNYQLPKCWKAVYYWSVSSNTNGTASLTINLHQPTTIDTTTLVNIPTTDKQPEGLSGSTLEGLNGGEYYYSIQNTTEAWKIRLECQDNAPSAGTGMNIDATGWFVSDNYELSTCQNGIFSWSVKPDAKGTAKLVLYFCDMKRCVTMVNEEKMNMTQPITGQVTAMLQTGTYFIGAMNTLQPWSVTWECKD